MPRRPRQEEAGAIHHVFARGVDKRATFRTVLDCRRYLDLLAETVVRCGWNCLGYCLMPNHLHILVETPVPNLGRGMQRLHGDYAAGFNRRHGLSGHVFQGRYGSKRVTTDAQLWTVAAYIAQNPVEAKLCSRADDWEWSGHRPTLTGDAPPWLARGRLLELFGALGGNPLSRYASFVP